MQEDQAPREPIFNVPSSVLNLAGAISLAFFATMVVSPEMQSQIISWFAFVPARFGVAEDGIAYTFGGEPWTDYTSFFTYAFLHGGLGHLAMNMLWLVAMGSAVARRVGGARFTVFFFLACAGGALLHLWLHEGSLMPVVGASAGVSGLMAAAMRIMFAPKMFVRTPDGRRVIVSGRLPDVTDRRVLTIALVWVGINLVLGLQGMTTADGQVLSIAWEAHVGGFAVGLLAFSFFDRMTAN